MSDHDARYEPLPPEGPAGHAVFVRCRCGWSSGPEKGVAARWSFICHLRHAREQHKRNSHVGSPRARRKANLGMGVVGASAFVIPADLKTLTPASVEITALTRAEYEAIHSAAEAAS